MTELERLLVACVRSDDSIPDADMAALAVVADRLADDGQDALAEDIRSLARLWPVDGRGRPVKKITQELLFQTPLAVRSARGRPPAFYIHCPPDQPGPPGSDLVHVLAGPELTDPLVFPYLIPPRPGRVRSSRMLAATFRFGKWAVAAHLSCYSPLQLLALCAVAGRGPRHTPI